MKKIGFLLSLLLIAKPAAGCYSIEQFGRDLYAKGPQNLTFIPAYRLKDKYTVYVDCKTTIENENFEEWPDYAFGEWCIFYGGWLFGPKKVFEVANATCVIAAAESLNTYKNDLYVNAMKVIFKNYKQETFIENFNQSKRPMPFQIGLAKCLLDKISQVDSEDVYYPSCWIYENWNIENVVKSYRNSLRGWGALDWYYIMIASNYLNSEAFFNIPLVSKKCKDIIPSFRYNPIPIDSLKKLKIFPNLESLFLYNADSPTFSNSSKIKKRISWNNMTYREALKYTQKGYECKNVIFTDMHVDDNALIWTIPDMITDIKRGAFIKPSLKGIVIPDLVGAVYRIDSGDGCLAFLVNGKLILASFKLNLEVYRKRNEQLLKIDPINISNEGKIRIPFEVFVLDNCLFMKTGGTEIIISQNVKEIGSMAFLRSHFKKIEFEKGSFLKNIGSFAFSGCITRSIELPGSLEKIGYRAFAKSRFIRVRISRNANLRKIENEAFEGSNISYIELPDNLQEIGAHIFKNCRRLVLIDIYRAEDKSTDISKEGSVVDRLIQEYGKEGAYKTNEVCIVVHVKNDIIKRTLDSLYQPYGNVKVVNRYNIRTSY